MHAESDLGTACIPEEDSFDGKEVKTNYFMFEFGEAVKYS